MNSLHCLAVRQQNHPKETIFHLGHPTPSPNTAIRLQMLIDRCGYCAFNPVVANYCPIRSETHGCEVRGNLHCSNKQTGVGSRQAHHSTASVWSSASISVASPNC